MSGLSLNVDARIRRVLRDPAFRIGSEVRREELVDVLVLIVQQRVDAAKAEALAPIEALADAYKATAVTLAPEDDWGETIGDTIHADSLRGVEGQLRAAIRDGRGDGT